MIWATRRHVHIDRTACAWLIRRFVDPDAEFVFVDDPDEVPAEATPFDMRGVELGHRDGRCSFESILARYELDDPALDADRPDRARGRHRRRALRRARSAGHGRADPRPRPLDRAATTSTCST